MRSDSLTPLSDSVAAYTKALKAVVKALNNAHPGVTKYTLLLHRMETASRIHKAALSIRNALVKKARIIKRLPYGKKRRALNKILL